jgi:zinc dependent phospholipase C
VRTVLFEIIHLARTGRACYLLICSVLIVSQPLSGYSVLSHEEVIDLMWDSDLRPALLKRFPNATPEELKKAHAFAYGGSVIQDVGYYPLGNHKFTDMLHYVRTGDFLAVMIRDSRDLNEFAFALGALSHYAADSWGHDAINRSVPIAYPKLRAKYDDWVTYEDDRRAHLNTEFSFDVLEVAKHRYEAQRYHDFIGFQVSEDLLERAFLDSYGIPLDDFLHYDDLTLGTFRFTVSKIIPEATQIAIASRKHEIGKEKQDAARQQFLYHLSRADYEKEFGTQYRRPGIFARILGFILKLFPLGPAKVLGYKTPTPATEDLYFRSMDNVLHQYHMLLQHTEAGNLDFPNRNLDTGKLTRSGQYTLADRTYSELVRRLQKDHFRHLTPALKSNLLEYFSKGRPADIRRHDWEKTEKALQQLRTASTSQG